MLTTSTQIESLCSPVTNSTLRISLFLALTYIHRCRFPSPLFRPMASMTSRELRKQRREDERKSKNSLTGKAAVPPLPHQRIVRSAVLPASRSPNGSHPFRGNRSHRPRTSHGKAICSGNSLKHGLACGRVIIPGEDPAEFEALLSGLMRRTCSRQPNRISPGPADGSILVAHAARNPFAK